MSRILLVCIGLVISLIIMGEVIGIITAYEEDSLFRKVQGEEISRQLER